MNILSTFDGKSCGQIALDRLSIPITNYFASEIDKYAMAVTMANFPNTIQLGDITKIKSTELPQIDLLVGGPPCQGFSFAGKQLNFEDPRSKLFFEFVRLKNELSPRYFLLENVKMKKEYQDVISRLLGVEPILINSALVSAQNRNRLYWTNIPFLGQPKDKNILLRDILLDGSEKIGASRGRYLVDGKRQDGKMKTAGLTTQRLEIRPDEKSNAITTVQKDNLVICDKMLGKGGKAHPLTATYGFATSSNSILKKQRTMVKSPSGYRKLTPIECERLQTVPDNYTNHVSNSQRYKMLGNGWTVDVICHLLKPLLSTNLGIKL